MDVALIVTGDAEFGGLSRALERAFPDHQFRMFTPRKMNGFTSCRLTDDAPKLSRPTRRGNVSTEIADLADMLITAADPGRNGQPEDLVVLVEDLELANVDQPERVVGWLREAVRARINFQFSSQDRREKAVQRVRERCSFHLLVPMLEAHFHADPTSLDRAGAVRRSAFNAALCDHERFEVDDHQYLSPPRLAGKGSACWLNRAPEQRRKHPKAYLEFLCDPSLDGATTYDERTATTLLENLSWQHVISRCDAGMYLRSLLADLADTLAPDPGLRPLLADAHCAPITRSRNRSQDRVLRNL